MSTSLKMFLESSSDYFSDVDVIKFDPDKVDTHDIVNALMPTLVKMAYVQLSDDKKKYERTHTDEDDEPFKFTKDELEERLDDIVGNLKDRLSDLSSRELIYHINKMEKEFREPLVD